MADWTDYHTLNCHGWSPKLFSWIVDVMNRNHFPLLLVSQTADFRALLMFYECTSTNIPSQMSPPANGNTCRNGGYYISLNILDNVCSSLGPCCVGICVWTAPRQFFFHSTLLIRSLGFVILTTAVFKASRKFVVGMRLDLIGDTRVRTIIFSSQTFLLS